MQIGGVFREGRFHAPEVREATIYANDPANGSTFLKPEAVHFLIPFTGATIIDILGGHHFDLFTYVLGDFANITATAVNLVGHPYQVAIPSPHPPDSLSPSIGKQSEPDEDGSDWRQGEQDR